VLDIIAKSNIKAVIGMGITGLSVARYLARKGLPFILLDTRDEPANLPEFKQEFPGVTIELGALNVDTLLLAEEIILSPGVALAEPAIEAAMAQGVSVIGDIDLFAREAKAPIVAITGSNAKTTVTSLVGEMAKAAKVTASIGGNIGRPVLDLLNDESVQLYVLELSSFQLETTNELNASVACVLNLSPDHMDRYASLPAYVMAKQRIYFGAEKIVFNREDTLTQPPIASGVEVYNFGLNKPDRGGFGLLVKGGCEHLAYQFETILPISEIKLPGRHNLANALASLAIGQALGFSMPSMLGVLTTFSGLQHRCQWVRELDGVDYFNDSKGTNVGATLAAINGLSRAPASLVLIAGGVGKGAAFNNLSAALRNHVSALILFGRDAHLFADAVDGSTSIHHVASLAEGVSLSRSLARSGDAVLLSPACASFDMYTGFEARGEAFVECVEALQ